MTNVNGLGRLGQSSPCFPVFGGMGEGGRYCLTGRAGPQIGVMGTDHLAKHQFQPGHDPRRWVRGRQGRSLLEWVDELGAETDEGAAKHDAAALRAIAADDAAPHLKAAAAGVLLRMRAEGFARNGLPLANADIERVLDRTLGKPRTSVEVIKRDAKLTSVKDMRDRLLAECLANPDEARKAGLWVDSCQPALPAAGAAADSSEEAEAAQPTNVNTPPEAPPGAPNGNAAGGRASPLRHPEKRTRDTSGRFAKK